VAKESYLLQAIANGLAAGAVYTMIAACLALIIQSSRFIHFATGAVLATGALAFYAVAKLLGWGMLAGTAAALAAGLLLGAISELLIFRRLRARGSSALVLMVGSLGLLIMIEGVLGVFFGRQPLVLRTGAVVPAISLGAIKLTLNQLLSISSMLVIIAGLILVSRLTTFGRTLRALANDAELAFLVGIPVGTVTLVSFALSGAVAGWAGVLIGLQEEATPGMGFRPFLMAAAATVIGGQKQVLSAALGGLVVGVIQHVSPLIVSGGWQDAVIFGLLIVILILRPSGLFGRRLFITRT
jgi:branched-chain amino acid transport system permease protein